ADLARLPDLPRRFSIMSPGVCERVARAFEKNPWVDEVISVRKVYPNRIHVTLRLRRPVAGVRHGGRTYLVDGDGRRLGAGKTAWPDGTEALPVIVSTAKTLPESGEVWPDDGVQAGAAVARTLLSNRDEIRTRFQQIDVRRVGSATYYKEGEILLVTHQGTSVRWGRSPLLVHSPGELTPEEKIGKMIRFEQKRGPLSSYEYVDVRFENVHYGRRVRLVSDRDVRH
ncbi:MAG TPA: cell division protein FtsQ/DivIB, partial [Planctomycetota bacterium]|nr:cell division protein FtsQ/DivIB [Planctomycetota bacterium]